MALTYMYHPHLYSAGFTSPEIPASLVSSPPLDDADKQYEASLPPSSLEEDDDDKDDGADERYEAALLPETEEILQNPIAEVATKEAKKEDIVVTPKEEPIAVLNSRGGGTLGAYHKGEVVFWEIAWAGTSGNANEEFIELYASSTRDIALEGFTITKGDGTLLVGESGDTFASSHRIIAGGYFLLKRTGDTVNSTSAKAYDGALSNKGETLILKDALGNEIDSIYMSQGWAAGSNQETSQGFKPTMSFIEGMWQDGLPTPGFANEKVPVKTSEEVALPHYASSTIVISEIAWMGNASSSANEWIELVNATSSPVDLIGWTLSIQTGTTTSTITLKGSIDAAGYFLMERTDDASVPDVAGDLFYTGALSNEGALLILRDPTGAIISQAGALGSPWPAGDNTTKKTMQLVGNAWVSAAPTPRALNQADAPLALPPILINEVAWMGTVGASGDEWLELKNTTSTSINLAGWEFRFAKNASSTPESIIVFSDQDVIGPGEFFLLERSSSSTLPTLEGKVYSGNQMNNSGEFLSLVNAQGNIVDSVDGTQGWPAGINKTSPNVIKKSMERSGNDMSWYTYTKENGVAVDRKGNVILGSPGQGNSSEL